MTQISSDIRHEAAKAWEIIGNELEQGSLHAIAAARVEELPENVTEQEVADIVLPDPNDGTEAALEPRWTLVDRAEAHNAVREVTQEQQDRIFGVANELGMRLLSGTGARLGEGVDEIEPGRAKFVVEGGANKTSIVRRGVAEKAIQAAYGPKSLAVRVYQFGSDRQIAPERNGAPNKEHEVIRSLTDEFAPDEPFTEFDANLATALEDGYDFVSLDNTTDAEMAERVQNHMLVKSQFSPWLHLVQPKGKGLEGALDTLPITSHEQIVVATNGQYRPKARLQTALWAKRRKLDNMSILAIGDEPGDVFPYSRGDVTVPDRPASAYVNEMVVLWRLANKVLASSR